MSKYARDLEDIDEDFRERMLDEYEKYYEKTYGVDERLGERARAFKEAEIRRAGGIKKYVEKLKAEKLAALEEKRGKDIRTVEEKAASKIAQSYRTKKDCPNLTPEQLREYSPSQIIHLKLKKSSRQEEYLYVCYDVVALYEYLNTTYRDSFMWQDPTTKLYYNNYQSQMIKDRYNSLSGCSALFTSYEILINDKLNNLEILVPKSLYEKSLSQDITRLIFRIYNKKQKYEYGVVKSPHNKKIENIIEISQDLAERLSVKNSDSVVLESCFHLPKLTYIQLRPITVSWFDLPMSAVDDVKEVLTEYFEKQDVLRIGQIITIEYGTNKYRLRITDLIANKTQSGLEERSSRYLVGSPKFTELEVDIVGRLEMS